jgi:hypothetical protein
LAASANPSPAYQQVTFTATVSPTPDGGTVKFTDGGVTVPGCAAVALSSGHFRCSETITSARLHAIKAIYTGDAGYGGSTGTMTENVSTQYSLPDIQRLFTIPPMAATEADVEADFRQNDPHGTCTMSIARSVFGFDPPFDADLLVPLPSLSPNGGNPFPCAASSSGIVSLSTALSYVHKFSGLSPLTTYDVFFSITNAAGAVSQTIQFTTPANAAPKSGGTVNATVNVPSDASGGTADGSTSASGSCISIVNGKIVFSKDPVCAAPVRARSVTLGKVVVKDLKPGTLTLHVKPTKKVRKAARKAHIHRLRAKLTIVIHSKSGKVVDKMTQKVLLRF